MRQTTGRRAMGRRAAAGAVALVGLALLLPAAAHAQLAQIELGLKLRGYYGKGKFIYNSPKYQTNYDDCRARGESDEFCRTLVGICIAQEQPFFGGPYAGLFRGLGLNQVFKLDCGSQECFQCCHVPGQPCHTSFVGFPVINCNERYGAGTRPAGMTLVTDPDPMPGEACLTIPQTCDHIPICAAELSEYADLRQRLDAGEDHPITMPGAAENRARQFARLLGEKWCGAIDRFHTGLPRDPEIPSLERVGDIQDFLTGRGCEGWRANVGAVFPFDWTAEAFAVRGEDGEVLPASSHRNALCQWGLFRALESVPGLGERLTAVESTVWPDVLRDLYLDRVDDPDAAILRHASPVVLDLLRCVPTIYDHRLLAVPLDGEEGADRVFNGCDLGRAPRVFLDAASLGDGRVALDVEVRDPEAGGPHEAVIPLTIFWGDGRVSLEEVAAGGGTARFEHAYDAPGARTVMAMAENTSGLRGFGAAIAEVEGAGAPAGPVVVSELRLVDVEARVDTLTGNARTLSVSIEGHDASTDLSYRLGLTPARQIDLFEPTDLGTWIAYNTGAAPIDRFILRFRWREGFYTGLRAVTLHPGRIEMHVLDTATGESVPIEVPIGPDTIRAFPAGEMEPLPPEALTDEEGNFRLVLHDRDRRIGLITIAVPQDLLAAQAPGPMAEDHDPLNEESWFEDRPGQFVAVGRGPDAGLPDVGPMAVDGGVPGDVPGTDGGESGDDGGATGCAVRRGGGPGAWGLAWLLLGALGVRARRRG